MIVTLTNVKGGVGKTTTAVNLAAAFARSGLRVLVVDLDPQGSATFSLGVAEDEGRASVHDLLVARRAAAEVIGETDVEGLDLIAGSMELAAADVALARRRRPTWMLRQALQPVRRRYDVIVIDCPPGLSLLTTNGLLAGDGFIVPVVPHDLSLEALARFFAGWKGIRAAHRTRAQALGVLLTMVDHRTALTETIAGAIRDAYGRLVFDTEIPINVRLAEAPGFGLTIFEYESWSTGAAAYARLGAEVLRRCRKAGLT